jgi:hypothetical protein
MEQTVFLNQIYNDRHQCILRNSALHNPNHIQNHHNNGFYVRLH